MYDVSKSWSETSRGPLAGSFTHHPLRPCPSTTRKWLNSQKTTNGAASSRSSPGPMAKPRASRPKWRAARTTFPALLPSRETPQASLSFSSGSKRPW